MLPWDAPLAGRLDRATIDSALLRDNVLGDPSVRPIWVYTPPGYDDSTDRWPTVYVIQGYTGNVAMWANRMPYRQPFIETADAVFAAGEAPGCIVVYGRCVDSVRRLAVRGLARHRPLPTRTSATRWSRGWMRATARSPTANPARSPESRPAALEQ